MTVGKEGEKNDYCLEKKAIEKGTKRIIGDELFIQIWHKAIINRASSKDITIQHNIRDQAFPHARHKERCPENRQVEKQEIKEKRRKGKKMKIKKEKKVDRTNE